MCVAYYVIAISVNFYDDWAGAGTPLQNSIKELWALLHFLDAHKFPSCEYFESQHSLDSADQVQTAFKLTAECKMYVTLCNVILSGKWHDGSALWISMVH